MAQVGLQDFEYETLHALMIRDTPGRASPGELAQEMGVSNAGVSGRLESMEKKGWLKRMPGADDRRRVEVEATREGLRIWREAMSLRGSAENEVAQVLTAARAGHPQPPPEEDDQPHRADARPMPVGGRGWVWGCARGSPWPGLRAGVGPGAAGRRVAGVACALHCVALPRRGQAALASGAHPVPALGVTLAPPSRVRVGAGLVSPKGLRARRNPP